MSEKEFYETIKLTDIKGLGDIVKTQLNNIGIFSIVDLAVADAELIAGLRGISKDNAVYFILAAQRLLRESNNLTPEFCTANDVLEKRKKVIKITTGSKDLDKLLFGGIESMSLTELYGEFGSGKSQVCHTLCVNATLPIEEGGANSTSFYIDTEGTFRPERIRQIAESKGLDPEAVADKIKFVQIFNASHLELTIRNLGGEIEKHKPKLIIIDSIISLHKAEYTGRGTLAERQQRLNPMMHHIIKLAEMYNIAFVMTNQVISNPDTTYGADPVKPSGGNIIGHISTYRIYLRRSGKNRMARIIDSPYHPYSDVKFKVTENGVEDLSDQEKKGTD
jgi:DNA repair protein RadA